jgi:hypothetical protein
MQKLATILFVERIEPSLPFWTEALGFAVVHRLEHAGALGFAMLAKGDLEIHLQTRAITRRDAPELAGFAFPPANALYFDVDDLDALEPKLAGLEVLRPRHQTFYGTTELYVREPGGHVIGFAQLPAASASV